MTTQLNMVKDLKGANTFGIPFSDTGTQFLLTQNVANSYTVPGGSSLGTGIPSGQQSYLAVITCSKGADIWVSLNATAVLPTTTTPTDTQSRLNIGVRSVSAGDVISIITPEANVQIGIELFSNNPG